MTRVVCAGLATLDTIFRVPSLPPADGRVLATEVVVAGGGPAATAAVVLARLGLDAAFVGAVGDDVEGEAIRAGLAQEGVDVAGVAVVPGAVSPRSTVLVGPAGERAIVHHPGDARLPDGDVDADWLHVDHVGFGRVRGLSPDTAVSVDAGNPIGDLDLRGVKVYAPTEDALRTQFGNARAALDAGAELVVATRGARGSVAYLRDGDVVEADGVELPVVSTLGAGDVFHGALVAYLVRGAAVADALRAANTAAALACRALDGRSAAPTRDELEGSLV